MNRIVYRSTFPVPVRVLFGWHERPGAFGRLSPPWQDVQVIEAPERLENGRRMVMEVRQGPLSKRWVTEHVDVEAGSLFRDRQVEGPFASWMHTHRFEPVDAETSLLIDEIEYALPLAPITEGLAGRWASAQLDRLFTFRHAVLATDLQRYGDALPGKGRVVLVTGHRGLIGSRLLPLLRTLGFTVRGLTRTPRAPHEYGWDYRKDQLDPEALKGVDAVIHLAGENIAGGRWTDDRRRRIIESREKGTALIAREVARMDTPPGVLVSASGIHFYAADGIEHGEAGGPGNGFLAEVCQRWEAAADPARAAGVRVVHPRLGVVLSAEGGALAKMLPAFLAGGGGPIGNGQQNFPWIAIDDVLDVLVEAVIGERLEGPVNVVAPEPVSQREFAGILGRVLRRPSRIPFPAAAVRTLFGRMGEETLLADVRAQPARLRSIGYAWRHPAPEDALRHLLGRPHSEAIPRLRQD